MAEVDHVASNIRKTKYRNILDEIENIYENEENNSSDPEHIIDILDSVDKLLLDGTVREKIAHTEEYVLDATVIAKTNYILNKITRAIAPVVDTYNPSEFGSKLRIKLQDSTQNDQIDWSKLFETSRKLLKVTPNFTYMCGFEPINNAEDEAPKEKKARQRKENPNQQIALKQPEKLVTVNKEEDSVDDTVKFIFWTLNKEYKNNGNKPINYYKFTIDPDSFSHTIENSFHLSFLMRDARVNVNIANDGTFVISPVSSKESRKNELNLPFLQYISAIDTTIWREASKKYKIRSSPLKEWKTEWEDKKKQK